MRNGFERCLEQLNINREEAAFLLNKTVRAIKYYERGKVVPPVDTRMLMTVMADGVRPKPLAIQDARAATSMDFNPRGLTAVARLDSSAPLA